MVCLNSRMFEQLLFLLINIMIRKLNDLSTICLELNFHMITKELVAQINYCHKPEQEEKVLIPVRTATETILKGPEFTKKDTFERAKTDPHLKYDGVGARSYSCFQLEKEL